jgi:hypothetical protein
LDATVDDRAAAIGDRAGPGPDRMLSGVMADATMAAEAGANNAAALTAATNSVLLNRMA